MVAAAEKTEENTSGQDLPFYSGGGVHVQQFQLGTGSAQELPSAGYSRLR